MIVAWALACTEGSAPADLTPAATGLTVEVSAFMPTQLVVRWQQTGTGVVEVGYRFEGEVWSTTPARGAFTGTEEEVLLGLPPGVDVDVELRLNGVPVETSSATTGTLDPSFPLPSQVSWDPSLAHPAPWVLGSLNKNDGGWIGGTYYVFIMDRQGRVVWLLETPNSHWSLYPRPSRDGTHLVIDESTYWTGTFDASGGMLHRLTIDGVALEDVQVPGLHHSWDEFEDGTFVWGALSGFGTETLDVRTPDDVRATLWNSSVYFDQVGLLTYSESNTVNYNPGTGTVLISFYTNDTVVEVDATTGEGLRHFGALEGSYAFEPAESQFSWQHGVNWTAAGTLLCSTHPQDGAREQRAREYAVDATTETLTEVWSYGEGTGKFAPTAGEASRLDNGNTLINYGGDAGIREITADGTIVWDVDWDGEKLIGHTTLLTDLYALRGPS